MRELTQNELNSIAGGDSGDDGRFLIQLGAGVIGSALGGIPGGAIGTIIGHYAGEALSPDIIRGVKRGRITFKPRRAPRTGN